MTSIDTAPDGTAAGRTPSVFPARFVLVVAAVFLGAGALLYLGAISRLLWPAALSEAAFLSFGRLLPVSTGLLLGWLLLAAVGAAAYVLPRIGGGPLHQITGAAFGLTLVGILVGVASVATGAGDGGRYLEGPWYGEAILAVGLLLAAFAVTRSARAADDLPMSGWYLVGALWWGFAAAAVAAVPGLEGIPAALQSRFAATVLAGLVPAAAGLGAVYYLVGRLVSDAAFHPRLGPIGFWSLGFSWLWLGPSTLQFGPTPDWLETIPVLFSFGLVVAMLAILADLAHATRGRWDALRGSRPLQVALAGSLPFVLLVGQQLVTSLRGPSGVVHFTDWESAFDLLLLLGAATLWLGGLTAHALAAERRWNRMLGAVHLDLAVAGLLSALIGFWVSGLQQGYTWVAAVNSETPAVGDAFRSSVVPLEAMRATAFIGVAMLALGTLAFLAAALIGFTWRPRDEVAVPPAGAGSRVAPIWQGALLLFTLAGLATFGLPAIDVGADPSALAAATREHPDASPQAKGREIYLAEGCWQCHTQQVRSIVTDVGLGTVSVPADYVYDGGDLLGARRIGPDLTHVAGRGWDFASLLTHLTNPREARPWSVMPSYGYLTVEELESLALYLAGLE